MESSPFGGLPNCYRFRSNNDYTIEELQRGELYLPNRTQLNDPFDCYPGLLEIPNDVKELKKYSEHVVKKRYPNKGRQERKQMAKTLWSNVDEFRQMLERELMKVIDDHGIGCFGLDISNLAMWSHYANFHKGICLQFDINKDRDLFYGLYHVNYTKEFKKINFIPNQSEIDSMMHLIYTKSEIWRYEQEYRIFKPKSGYNKFNPNSLQRIIFGMQAETSFIEKIKEVVKQIYPHVEFWFVTPLPSAFGIRLLHDDQ